MKRIIVDYKKLTPEILSLLVSKYPDGYDDDDIISFRNAQNQIIEAVEVRDEDAIYLVKVSAKLEASIANFEEDEEEIDTESNDAFDDSTEIPETDQDNEVDDFTDID
jgi:seryl-tRNA synthetase